DGAASGRAGRGHAGGGGVRRHRLRVPRRGTTTGQRGPASRPGEPEKKGYVGSSVTCEHCSYAAKFHSYQRRRIVTVHGAVWVRRGSSHFRPGQQSVLPP